MYHEKMTSTKIREKICMYAFGSWFFTNFSKKSSFLSRLQNKDKVDIGNYEDF